MGLKRFEDLETAEKRVFVRVDFNCPLKEGKVADDSRIRAAIPTIKALLAKDARLVLASHLGRPKGKVVKEMSLAPVGEKLSELLGGMDIFLTDDCVGDGAKKVVTDLRPGQVALLENLRFHKEETDNDEAFSRKLASLCDVYVNDAFGAAHRAHASVEGITRFAPEKAMGLLLRREVDFLTRLLQNPEKPFLAILGGAKVSDKIGVIKHLLDRVDQIVIGGAMAYTFLEAQGFSMGQSLVEKDQVETALRILEAAKARHVKLLLPIDHVAAEADTDASPTSLVGSDGFPAGLKGLDIGPASVKLFAETIATARTIFWNGPMGRFEVKPFAAGTMEIARAVAANPGTTVVGGGDSVAAINRAGVADQISHISTGGGASLEFMEGKVLPGVAALSE